MGGVVPGAVKEIFQPPVDSSLSRGQRVFCQHSRAAIHIRREVQGCHAQIPDCRQGRQLPRGGQRAIRPGLPYGTGEGAIDLVTAARAGADPGGMDQEVPRMPVQPNRPTAERITQSRLQAGFSHIERDLMVARQ